MSTIVAEIDVNRLHPDFRRIYLGTRLYLHPLSVGALRFAFATRANR